MNITENIKREIRAKGYSLKEFAELLGVSYMGVIKSLERPDYRVSTLQRYADALGIDVAAFLSDSDSASSSANAVCPHCGKPFHIEIKP